MEWYNKMLYDRLLEVRKFLEKERYSTRRIDKLIIDKMTGDTLYNHKVGKEHPVGCGFGIQIIIDDHLCPKDYLKQSKKQKHKPFYKELNGKKLKKWER
jgi:hypothetical protein